jgi:uncharacterized repeat protein (TIGR01451 family)
MRKINLFAIVSFFILFLANNAYSQCGVHPKFDIEQNGGVTVAFNTTLTTLDANWKITKYKWLVNDVAKDSGVILSPTPYAYFLRQGVNKVDLILWGIDTITNDSCSAQYGNIFHSTGSILYVEMTVSTSGLNVTVMPQYWVDPSAPVTTSVDWGDGSALSQGIASSFMHTYNAAGDYVVNLNGTTATGNTGWDTRKVHVNNGLNNYIVTGLTVNTGCTSVSCGSVSVSPNSGLSGSNFYTLDSDVGSVSGGNLNLGSSLAVPLSGLIPGQYILRASVYENNSTYSINEVSSVTKSACGIEMDTIHGFVFADIDADGIQDSNEVGLANIPIMIHATNGGDGNFFSKTDSLGLFSIVIPRDLVEVALSYLYIYNLYAVTCPSTHFYTINNQVGGVTPYLHFGLCPLNVTVSGSVFYDVNNNSTFNSGVDLYPKTAQVVAQSTMTGYSASAIVNSYGSYSLQLPSGNYKLTVSDPMVDSLVSNPDSIMLNATSGNYSNKNFYLNTPVNTDFDVWVMSTNPRPGFPAVVDVHLRQTGLDSSWANVILQYDPAITIDSIWPTNGLINSTFHTVQWPTGKVDFGGQRYFKLYYTPATTVPLGTQYNFSVNALALLPSVEYDTSNNSASDIATVIGSFDPNDKSVRPIGQNGVGDVKHNTRLHYHINFQNTGTASAINVFVQDVLNANLDASSYVFEGSSHTCLTKIIDGTITWQFYNINLLDSNTNEPLSHGWVEFSMLPKQGLPDGTVISNEAAIYFDFNSPVITNTVVNTLQSVITSVNSNDQYNSIIAYPVPVNDVLHLVSNTPMSGKVLVKVFSADGKLIDQIITHTNTSKSLDISFAKYENGFYVLELLDNDRSCQVKVVK